MLTTVLELLLAPGLVGASTVATTRWQERVGGVVSAFPAIVGPLLLVAATTHDAAFAGRAATGVLLGLAALSGFTVAYAWVCRSQAWPFALAAGWTAAAGLSVLARAISPTPSIATVVATASLLLAYGMMPCRRITHPRPDPGGQSVCARMSIAFVLVASLSVCADRFGAAVGGLLAALPVLASVLACATHRQHGSDAAVAFLRGMLAGLGGFVAFCGVIAGAINSLGTARAFALALGCALAAQGVALALNGARPGVGAVADGA